VSQQPAVGSALSSHCSYLYLKLSWRRMSSYNESLRESLFYRINWLFHRRKWSSDCLYVCFNFIFFTLLPISYTSLTHPPCCIFLSTTFTNSPNPGAHGLLCWCSIQTNKHKQTNCDNASQLNLFYSRFDCASWMGTVLSSWSSVAVLNMWGALWQCSWYWNAVSYGMTTDNVW
jgi:hypothetical protein